MTTTVKFYKVNAIGKAVRALDTQRRDLTISALYHAVIHGNVSFLKGFSRADAACFDSTLRALLPVTYRKDGEFYQFDAKKLVNVMETLGVNRDTHKEFPVFAETVLDYWNMYNQRTKEAELDAQAVHDKAAKAFPKMLDKMYSEGLTASEMETMFIMWKKAHTLVQAA